MSQYIPTTYFDACLHGLRLANAYNLIYLRAFQKAVEEEREAAINGATVAGGGGSMPGTGWLDSIYGRWLNIADEELDAELKSTHFISILSRYMQLLLELRSLFRNAGYPVDYLDLLFDWYVRIYLAFSHVQKESRLAPFDVVYRKGKTRLLHYLEQGREVSGERQKQPLLIIYAPINTFHILDLNPKRSVVRDLLASGGLDIYLLDWGYPDWSDNRLSLDDYLGYVNDAVRAIKDQTRQSKVSILGYCWGGIFALIHASLNPEDVRSLVLMAVPVDFSKDDTILAKWARAIDIDSMMDEFGRMDGQVLDMGFLMRNPPRYGFDRHLKLFQMAYDPEFVDTIMDFERWLCNTPPVPGVLHKQIINDCYRNNLLISGQMASARDGKKQKVDLGKISAPVLSIIAEEDDLVSPSSSVAINDYISSRVKSVLKIPGGHVGLCVGNAAHSKLWPEAAKWLLSQ